MSENYGKATKADADADGQSHIWLLSASAPLRHLRTMGADIADV
jgi:hypothetical protein